MSIIADSTYYGTGHSAPLSLLDSFQKCLPEVRCHIQEDADRIHLYAKGIGVVTFRRSKARLYDPESLGYLAAQMVSRTK